MRTPALALSTAPSHTPRRFGNRYFENMNGEEEIPGTARPASLHNCSFLPAGRHRWVDLAQHEYNASQVPPEWHSWISHIRQEPPTNDPAMQQARPKWIGVREDTSWTSMP